MLGPEISYPKITKLFLEHKHNSVYHAVWNTGFDTSVCICFSSFAERKYKKVLQGWSSLLLCMDWSIF